MSFLGHPVCRLGLNWCIFLGLFIVFSALATNACAVCCFPLGNKIRVIMHLKYLIPMHSKIMYYKTLAKKWHYRLLLLGCFGTLYGTFIFHILSTKYIYLLLLLISISFPDKNLWVFISKKKGRSCWGC